MPTKPTTPAITADEARRLVAEYNARPPRIRSYLGGIYALIREAAISGATSSEFTWLWGAPPEQKDLDAIVAVLIGKGYGVSWVETLPPVLVISWD